MSLRIPVETHLPSWDDFASIDARKWFGSSAPTAQDGSDASVSGIRLSNQALQMLNDVHSDGNIERMRNWVDNTYRRMMKTGWVHLSEHKEAQEDATDSHFPLMCRAGCAADGTLLLSQLSGALSVSSVDGRRCRSELSGGANVLPRGLDLSLQPPVTSCACETPRLGAAATVASSQSGGMPGAEGSEEATPEQVGLQVASMSTCFKGTVISDAAARERTVVASGAGFVHCPSGLALNYCSTPAASSLSSFPVRTRSIANEAYAANRASGARSASLGSAVGIAEGGREASVGGSLSSGPASAVNVEQKLPPAFLHLSPSIQQLQAGSGNFAREGALKACHWSSVSLLPSGKADGQPHARSNVPAVPGSARCASGAVPSEPHCVHQCPAAGSMLWWSIKLGSAPSESSQSGQVLGSSSATPEMASAGCSASATDYRPGFGPADAPMASHIKSWPELSPAV